jgi:hypothetical protein
MPLGSSLLSLQAGVVRLINKVRPAQVRQAAKGRDYSVMKEDMARRTKPSLSAHPNRQPRGARTPSVPVRFQFGHLRYISTPSRHRDRD